MTIHDVEKFLRETYPTACHLEVRVDHLRMVVIAQYDTPTTMHGVWGLDRVEQFPPGDSEGKSAGGE